MSIYKLKNGTGIEVIDKDLGNGVIHTFGSGQSVDLLDDLGLMSDDILGSKGGSNYETILAIVKSQGWCLHDGDNTYSSEESIHLLKYGNLGSVKTRPQVNSLQSGTSFESHNLGDSKDWTIPDVDSTFTISPTSGKKLHLTGSKVIIEPDFDVKSDLYFRVFMDYEVSPGVISNIMVREDVYSGTDKLLMGCSGVFTSPQVGNPTAMGRGSKELIHIVYKYANPITLYSSLNMRLEIGIVDDVVCPIATTMKLRIEAISESE